MAMTTKQLNLEPVEFESDDAKIPLNLDGIHETIWASQHDMAQLFGKDIRTIGEHLRNIFRGGELDEASVIRKFRKTAADGKEYKVLHYNLDVILSVGYRVSSKKATKFRQWATRILKSYIVDGYVLNESRLAQDVDALSSLAAKVRRLRSGEKQIYESVRECFKITASDYQPGSQYTKRFYAQLQDKFLYAITGKTAAQVVIDRANHREDLMGLTSTKSGEPTIADAKIGKNYLMTNELYALHLLCEQFLLFVETRAVQGRELTMADLATKFDLLLEVQGHPVFPGYKEKLRAKAESHAREELTAYRQRMRLERTSAKRIAG